MCVHILFFKVTHRRRAGLGLSEAQPQSKVHGWQEPQRQMFVEVYPAWAERETQMPMSIPGSREAFVTVMRDDWFIGSHGTLASTSSQSMLTFGLMDHFLYHPGTRRSSKEQREVSIHRRGTAAL